MTKKEIIAHLRNAKSTHIQWRAYAQALVAGIPVEQDHVPVVHTNCKFGKWYYGPGQQLSFLKSYAAIDTPHEMLHKIYMKIFKLLFGKDERSGFQKLFGSNAKLKLDRQKEADVLMQKLLAISETLLKALTLLEEEIKGMSEEELSSLY